VALASRGARNLDDGVTQIEDPAERAAVRAQARRVHLQSAAVALLLTLVAVVVG
jgi:hypothetical protein